MRLGSCFNFDLDRAQEGRTNGRSRVPKPPTRMSAAEGALASGRLIVLVPAGKVYLSSWEMILKSLRRAISNYVDWCRKEGKMFDGRAKKVLRASSLRR